MTQSPAPRHTIQNIAVYCGSRTGSDPAFAAAADQFGRTLALAGLRLIYGGGSVGLMGILARGAMAVGGTVMGVIPGHLHHVEITQTDLAALEVVPNMHNRKQRMFEEADAFVSLPGSIGTLDETIEVITWRQLGLHDKPILLVNLNNYWDPFLALIDHIIAQDFANGDTRRLFTVVPDLASVLPTLAQAPAPAIPDREHLL